MIQECKWEYIGWEYDKNIECFFFNIKDLTNGSLFSAMYSMKEKPSKWQLTFERLKGKKKQYIPKYYIIYFLKNVVYEKFKREPDPKLRQAKIALIRESIRNVLEIKMS